MAPWKRLISEEKVPLKIRDYVLPNGTKAVPNDDTVKKVDRWEKKYH